MGDESPSKALLGVSKSRVKGGVGAFRKGTDVIVLLDADLVISPRA